MRLLVASGSSLLIAPGVALLLTDDGVEGQSPKTLTILDEGHDVSLRDRGHTASAQENR